MSCHVQVDFVDHEHGRRNDHMNHKVVSMMIVAVNL